jgi:hypothetical protein
VQLDPRVLQDPPECPATLDRQEVQGVQAPKEPLDPAEIQALSGLLDPPEASGPKVQRGPLVHPVQVGSQAPLAVPVRWVLRDLQVPMASRVAHKQPEPPARPVYLGIQETPDRRDPSEDPGARGFPVAVGRREIPGCQEPQEW